MAGWFAAARGAASIRGASGAPTATTSTPTPGSGAIAAVFVPPGRFYDPLSLYFLTPCEQRKIFENEEYGQDYRIYRMGAWNGVKQSCKSCQKMEIEYELER
jgi:hypothetical protein